MPAVAAAARHCGAARHHGRASSAAASAKACRRLVSVAFISPPVLARAWLRAGEARVRARERFGNPPVDTVGIVSDGQPGGGAADRRARAAPRRLGARRARHGAAARLPPARPDRDRRAAAAPRALEPARRAYDTGRARPAALGRPRSSSSGTPSSGRSSRCRSCARGCGAPARDAVRAATAGGATSSPANAAFRRYVLRELERRGPLLSRELEDRSVDGRLEHRWYGSR